MKLLYSPISQRRFAYLMLIPTFALFGVVTVYPLIHALELSFHSMNLLKPSLGRNWVGLRNYREMLLNPLFWNALKITLTFAAGTVVLQFLLGMIIALVLNKEFRGKNLARTTVLLPLLITPVIIGLMWRWLLNPEVGLINYLLGLVGVPTRSWLGNASYALASVVAVDVWHLTPFTILVVLAGLQSIDPELYEAGRIDGCSASQTFRFITLPLLSPVILVVLLLTTMSSFREFDKIYSLTQGGPGRATEVLGFLVYRVSFKDFYMGEGAALSYMILLVILLIASIYIRLMPRLE
jgi:multiple sugar transport system permease protein